ncbi:PAS domain S-box protein, partial [Candidatus Hydrogenedentota bacterium]
MDTPVILVIDDKAENLSLFEELLKRFLPDVRILTAQSADEGLHIAAKNSLDCALVDVQMPGMDGLEMCRRLKAGELTSHIPVILITGYDSDADYRALCLDSGADDFITKPIQGMELAARIRVMLRIKQAEDDLRLANESLESLVSERTVALQNSEEQLRVVAESTSDYLMNLDLDFNVLYINRTEPGLTKEDVLGEPLYAFAMKEQQLVVKRSLEKAVKTGEPIQYETQYERPDGSMVYFESNVTPTEANGQLNGLTVIARDVTERKAKGKELRRSQAALECVDDAVSVHGKDFRVLWQNAKDRSFWGDVIGQLCYEAYEGRSERCPHCAAPEVMRDGRARQYQTKVRLKNGEEVDLEVSVAALRDDKDEITGFIDSGRDITQRRRAEKELRETSTRLKTIFSVIQEHINIISLDGTVLWVNDASARAHPDCIGKKCWVAFENRDEDEGRCPHCVHEQLHANGESWEYETSVVFADTIPGPYRGKTTHWLVRAVPMRDVAGEIYAILEVAIDITERKRAEEALRDTSERLQTILETMEEQINIMAPDGTVLWVNENLPGVIPDCLGKKCWEVFEFRASRCPHCVHPLILVDGKTRKYETAVANPRTGGTIYWLVRAVPMRDASGEIEAIMEVAINITERKLAEDALRASEERFRAMFEQAADSVVVVDVEAGALVEFNDKA